MAIGSLIPQFDLTNNSYIANVSTNVYAGLAYDENNCLQDLGLYVNLGLLINASQLSPMDIPPIPLGLSFSFTISRVGMQSLSYAAIATGNFGIIAGNPLNTLDWIVIIGIGAIIVTIIVVSISTRKRISSHDKLIGEITESAGKVLLIKLQRKDILFDLFGFLGAIAVTWPIYDYLSRYLESAGKSPYILFGVSNTLYAGIILLACCFPLLKKLKNHGIRILVWTLIGFGVGFIINGIITGVNPTMKLIPSS